MSFIEPALYEASAFARAKCICRDQSQPSRQSRNKTTYKIDIVLDQIPLERLQRERPISHGQHKRVVNEPFPHGRNIGPLEEVVEEVTPELKSAPNALNRRR